MIERAATGGLILRADDGSRWFCPGPRILDRAFPSGMPFTPDMACVRLDGNVQCGPVPTVPTIGGYINDGGQYCAPINLPSWLQGASLGALSGDAGLGAGNSRWTTYPTSRPIASTDPTGGIAKTWEYGGVDFTIERMRKMVYEALMWEQGQGGSQDGLLRRHVESIIAQVRPKDYLSEIAAIYYYILLNLRYTRDHLHKEFAQHPLMILQPTAADRAAGRRARQDDCEAISTTLAAMCMSIGNPCSFCTISTKPNSSFHHVFCTVKMPNSLRVVIDPVAGPEVRDMLASTRRYQFWDVEPVRYSNSSGWGVAGAPSLEGVGPPQVDLFL